MPTSRLSARSLKHIRKFLENECTWALVRKGLRHREYRAICSQSPCLGKVSDSDDGRCLCASMMMFKRNDGYVICISVNKQTVGQFLCAGVRRNKLVIEGFDDPIYSIRLLATLIPFKLGFTPYIIPMKSAGGATGLAPGIIYQNACVVNEDEVVKSKLAKMNGDFIGLGGVGAWVHLHDEIMEMYVMSLCFDLYATCCDRVSFPSMAKIFFDMVRCTDDMCTFCTDSGMHVDPTGKYCGCTPDVGVCFCYCPCNGTDAPVTNRNSLPYLEKDKPIHSLFVRRLDGKKGMPAKVSDCIGAKDKQGMEVPIRTDPWQLLKLDPGLSRIIILSCPVLKRIILEHM